MVRSRTSRWLAKQLAATLVHQAQLVVVASSNPVSRVDLVRIRNAKSDDKNMSLVRHKCRCTLLPGNHVPWAHTSTVERQQVSFEHRRLDCLAMRLLSPA